MLYPNSSIKCQYLMNLNRILLRSAYRPPAIQDLGSIMLRRKKLFCYANVAKNISFEQLLPSGWYKTEVAGQSHKLQTYLTPQFGQWQARRYQYSTQGDVVLSIRTMWLTAQTNANYFVFTYF